MESRGSQRRRNLKRKPLFDLTNTTSSLWSSSSSHVAFPLKPYRNPKPKPKPQSSDPTPPQSSNPDETSARSNSGFNSSGSDEHEAQIVVTPTPTSRETFLDSGEFFFPVLFRVLETSRKLGHVDLLGTSSIYRGPGFPTLLRK